LRYSLSRLSRRPSGTRAACTCGTPVASELKITQRQSGLKYGCGYVYCGLENDEF